MAISTTTNTVLLAGNSSTVVFPYSFPFYNQTDLHVYLFDTIAGGIVQQTLNSNYSIAATPDSTGIYPNGGNVIFTSSVVSTQIVVIDRQPIETQTFAILQNGFISSVGLVHQLDYLTLLIQDMADRVSRSAALPTGFGMTNTFNPALPSGIGLQSNAGLYLAINSTATGFVLAGSSIFPTGAAGLVFTGNGVGFQPSFQPVNVSGSNVSGTLSLGNGGTGGLTPSTWGVVFASSATQLATTAPGPVGFPLVANASSAPTFQAISLALVGSGAIGIAAGGTGTGQVPLNFSVPYMASPTGYGYANPGGANQLLTANASSAPTFQTLTLNNGSGVLAATLGGTGTPGPFQPFQLFAGSGTTQMQQLSGTPTWVLVANSSAIPSFQQLSLSGSALTGTLPLSSGGTGVTTSPSVGAIPYGSGVGYSYLAVGSTGTVLQSFGPGTQPGWINPSSGLQYTSNQYGVVFSGSSSTQLNVVPPVTSNSTAFLVQSGATGAQTPAWRTISAPTVICYSSAGNFTFTTPSNPTPLYLEVIVVGAGGGGGGTASAASSGGAGGGGGGGGTAWSIIVGSLAASYTVSVGGGGGAGGAGNNAGGGGNTSFFNSSALSVMLAFGGSGGGGSAASSTSSLGGQGGAGGTATGGNLLNSVGGPGLNGSIFAAGSVWSGAGGDSRFGGGAEGTIGNAAGVAGNLVGGGGSGGAQANAGGTQGGGGGATGAVIVIPHYL